MISAYVWKVWMDDVVDLGLRGSAHASLRAATRDAHAAVEKHLDLSRLSERTAYIRFLVMNWTCASIELGLAQAGVERLLPDWSERERRSALAQDLRRLQVEPEPVSPWCMTADVGTLFGWAYVLEGSRLGARLILRTVAESPDPDVRGATSFLQHGEGKRFWPSFVAALATIDGDEATIGRAGVAARAGFLKFLQAAQRATSTR